MRVMTPVTQDNLRRVAAAGGTVVTGTDLSLGADFHRELELLQQAGLAPWDVLRCATVNGATFLAAIWQVVKDGQLIDRDGLDLPANEPGQ
jgi:imidazolonepropionase-like amidohydrolase